MVDFWKDKQIIVTGGAGFLGKHLVKLLKAKGCTPFVPRMANYDLRYDDDVSRMLNDVVKVDIVINLAANVGGIGYNQAHPYSLFYDNLQMGLNLIDRSLQRGISKFVQLGTVCAYPKWAKPPFNEGALWDGYPEETNAPYGLAKKMLLVQLQAARAEFDFNGIYLLPTNLYGPGDEFMPYRSHVIPALIKKFIEAKATGQETVSLWGTGKASRDFLYVEDAAKAIVLATEKYNTSQPLNIGSGKEIRISSLAYHIRNLTQYMGKIHWDTSMPDGQPRRGLDISDIKHALSWQPETELLDGLEKTIEWYMKQRQDAKMPIVEAAINA